MADPSQFFGFSPQNHQGETPTVTNPKYAVYNYLQNVDPRSAWAQSAADTLNKQFNTQEFKALDGETLGYGDEYVHSGQPGGGPGSLSNPGTGAGAFTWGSQPAPQSGQQDTTGGLGALLQALMGNNSQGNWSNWMNAGSGMGGGSGLGAGTPPPATNSPDLSQPNPNPVSTQPVGSPAPDASNPLIARQKTQQQPGTDPADPMAAADRAMKGVYF